MSLKSVLHELEVNHICHQFALIKKLCSSYRRTAQPKFFLKFKYYLLINFLPVALLITKPL